MSPKAMKRLTKFCRFIFAPVLVIGLSGLTHAQSPYRTSWELDGPIAASAGLLGIGALVVADNPDPLTQSEIAMLSPEGINAFDRGAIGNYSEGAGTASDLVVYATIAAPLVLLTQDRVGNDWQTYLSMYAETMALTGFAAQVVKGIAPRTRPFVYNPDAPLEPKLERDARKSFYSSHSAFAFASAVFLSVTYQEYFPSSSLHGFVWAGSLLLASTVGSLRYVAGAHFPTDILVGAAIGSAVGYVIPLLHRVETGDLSVFPAFHGQSTGLLIRYRL